MEEMKMNLRWEEFLKIVEFSDRFKEALEEKMRQGRDKHSDKSFDKDPIALCEEIQNEAKDLSGWGYVLWCRIYPEIHGKHEEKLLMDIILEGERWWYRIEVFKQILLKEITNGKK